ncbi:MAG TPA: 3-methyladenine DNA glycosylase [Mycobacterium sp.]
MSEAVLDSVRLTAVLDEAEWTERERLHVERVDRFVGPHVQRARRGEAHPVWDFLFSYYSLKPRQLRRWHPGYGVALGGTSAGRFRERSGYGTVGSAIGVTREHLLARIETVGFIADLMHATARRPARLNCFGLHEWAMVYRSTDIRHEVPLRLGGAATDAVVDSMPLRCSHFDAYRFFTEPAVPRNAEPLSRQSQVATEQPGCVHANMDLYKFCGKLGPLVESGLLMDCLDLAADARELDMRASPYDLTGYGFEPIAIETSAGRAEYVRAQQDVADRAAPLRAALADRCDQLLTSVRGD